MQEMVTDYAAALRKVQPHGPYHLMAWSAGGVVAFALADYLLAQGEEVGTLALFDTALPSAFAHFDVDDPSRFLVDMVHFTNRFAGTRIELSVDNRSEGTPEERFASAVRQAREQGIFTPAVKDEYIHRLVGVGAGMVKSIQSYTPKAIPTPMHLFLPKIAGGLEELTGLSIPPGNGWQSGLGQKVIEMTVPGDHFTMMLGEGARELAATINGLTT
jgi:myxalamid-type polyketide synthase MxaB